ncbi:MAG: aminopeptidase P family protein [Bacteroidota bacterium]
MRALWVCTLIVFLLCIEVVGQGGQKFSYDSDLLPSTFFSDNRNRLRELMPENSVAVFFSSPVRNRANDVNYVYHQDPDFYYLTGYRDPDAVLFVFKEPVLLPTGNKISERIIVRKRNEKRELWTGRIATPEEVTGISGIIDAMTSDNNEAFKLPFKKFKKALLSKVPEGVVNDPYDPYELSDIMERIGKKLKFETGALEQFMASLREIKKPEELILLQKAVDISVEGHLRMMDSVRTGWLEYQVEAVGEYVFHHSGAEDIGYPSICGAAENGCVLHYEKNRRKAGDGDLILLDMGAEYHGYTADITRTLPVNGIFSEPQRSLYDLVWEAQKAGIDSCVAGKDFKAPHRAAMEVIQEGLIKLEIIKEKSQAKKYFPHGTSHYLGLDVHDPGNYEELKPGQVITVEPGIYIPEGSDCDPKWWNIGIRIEDDILITDKEPVNMSGTLPSRSDLLEKRLKSGK